MTSSTCRLPTRALVGLLLLVCVLLVSAVLLACSGVLIAGELDGLRAGHPRLLVKDHAVWKELSARAEKDVDLKKLLRAIQADADRVLDLSPEKRVMVCESARRWDERTKPWQVAAAGPRRGR
jgi:hypothetical protein